MLSDSPLPRKRTHAPPWRGWRGLCAASWCTRRDEPAAPPLDIYGPLVLGCLGSHEQAAWATEYVRVGTMPAPPPRAQRGKIADQKAIHRALPRNRNANLRSARLISRITHGELQDLRRESSSSTLATSSTREPVRHR